MELQLLEFLDLRKTDTCVDGDTLKTKAIELFSKIKETDGRWDYLRIN